MRLVKSVLSRLWEGEEVIAEWDDARPARDLRSFARPRDDDLLRPFLSSAEVVDLAAYRRRKARATR